MPRVALLSEADYRRDVGLFFKSIHGTLFFNHLLVGRRAPWFVRFAEGLARRWRWTTRRTRPRAAAMPLREARLALGAGAPLIAGFARPLAHAATGLHHHARRAGPRGLRCRFAATLAHVFNHGTHHRGQITAALTALGQRLARLDLVYMLQNPTKPS